MCTKRLCSKALLCILSFGPNTSSKKQKNIVCFEENKKVNLHGLDKNRTKLRTALYTYIHTYIK